MRFQTGPFTSALILTATRGIPGLGWHSGLRVPALGEVP